MTNPTNLTIKQGSDCTITIPNVVDATGTLVAPSGITIRSQIRPRSDSATVLYEWSTSPTVGQGQATVTAGLVTLAVSAATSDAWPWSNGVFDVELTDASSKTARIAEGAIKISPQVTR